MRIDRYETKLEHGKINYYAVIGRKHIPMPEAFKDMYNEKYLEITETESEMPDVLGVPKGKFYIPRFTGDVHE